MKVRDPGGRDDPSFRRLGALLAMIEQPSLPRVYEVGRHDDQSYVIMDLVDGRPLTNVLGEGRLATADTIRLGIDLAGALTAAHQARLVHGDIRPGNIMITSTGQTRLCRRSRSVPACPSC